MVRPSVRIETGSKRVRVMVDGEIVADTTRPLLVWEKPFYPTYYIPTGDVRDGLLVPAGATRESKALGTGTLFNVKTADGERAGAALGYEDSTAVGGHIRLDWHAMDAWFEEDEEVFVHPRNPYTRVDALDSSRHVTVAVNGVAVADTRHPTVLFETGLPVRYYIPKVDVQMAMLTPTATVTHCPYKGTAEYWTVEAGGEQFPDYAWSYRAPVRESINIAGMVSFYNEKVDISVDGEPQDRPKTIFS